MSFYIKIIIEVNTFKRVRNAMEKQNKYLKLLKCFANKPRHDSDSSEANHFLSGYELVQRCIVVFNFFI